MVGNTSKEIPQSETQPTSLHLFRLKDNQIGALNNQLNQARTLNHQTIIAIDSQARLSAESRNRIDRLSEYQKELNEEYRLRRSGEVCSLMYLKMYDELYTGLGLTPEEFMDFYKMCLKSSIKYWEPYYEKYWKQGNVFSRATTTETRKMTTDVLKELTKLYGSAYPPKWFKGNREQWVTFVIFRTNSHSYLTPDPIDRQYFSQSDVFPPQWELPKNFGEGNIFTFSNGLPDWLVDHKEDLVPKQLVEQELSEDMKADAELHTKYQSIEDQKEYLASSGNQKGAHVLNRFKHGLKALFPQSPESFNDLLVYLQATDSLQLIHEDPEQVLQQFGAKELYKRLIPFSRHHAEIISDFASFHLTKEGVALFLERKLKEGKLINNASENTAAIASQLMSLLDSPTNPAALTPIKDQNKRMFNVLNYDLKPLVEQLAPEVIDYLKEIIEEYKNDPIEDVIWEMAEAINKHTPLSKFHLKKSTQPIERVLVELTNFSCSWLTNHWRWAAKEIDKALTKPEPVSKATQTNELISSDSEQISSSLEKEIQEIQDEVQSLQEGTLGGWKLLYTDNRTSNPNHLHEIDGKTLMERQDAFKIFLLKERIACPISPDSIIRALEWVTNDVPDQVEQIRMRMNIDGETFRKIKRGNSRILYILNPKDKSIIFFVYKKEAWNYRFK